MAVALGPRCNQQVLSQVENGRSSLLLDGAVKAVQTLDASLDYVTGLTDDPMPALTGRLPAVPPAPNDHDDIDDHDVASHLAISVELVETDGTVCVYAWDLDVAASGGSLFDAKKAIGRLSFRRKWLDRHGLGGTKCAVVTVRGESMGPTLPDRCSMLVHGALRRLPVGRRVRRTQRGRHSCEARDQGAEWVLAAYRAPTRPARLCSGPTTLAWGR